MINERSKYKQAYEKGKPRHSPYDSFSIKHPPMDLSRRAKIFSPFDALKGFDEDLTITELNVLSDNLPDQNLHNKMEFKE